MWQVLRGFPPLQMAMLGSEDLGRRLVTSLHAAVMVIETKLLPLSVQIFWYYRGALSSSLMWYIFVQCAFFFFQCVTTDIFAWYESTTVIRTGWTPLTPNCTFLRQCNNTNGTNGTLGLWRTYFNKNYFYNMNDTVFTEMFTIIDYGYLLTCSWLYASVYSLLLSVFVCVPV